MKTKQTKQKNKWRNRLINLLLLLLLLIGLGLIFNGQIKNFIVSYLSQKNQVSALTKEDLEKNNKKKGNFDFDQVESLDMETVAKAQMNQGDINVIAGIAVPSVGINLPIVKGVDNNALAIGAGTMKADQQMGKGNYALAGHHMIDKHLLFSPLISIQKGALVYLTDLKDIYTYEVDFIEYVSANRGDLIEDVPDKTIVTLVTCDATGAGRLIVQGKFKEKTAMKDQTSDMANAFNIAKNTY